MNRSEDTCSHVPQILALHFTLAERYTLENLPERPPATQHCQKGISFDTGCKRFLNCVACVSKREAGLFALRAIGLMV